MCLGSRFCREGRLCLELGEEVAALRRNFAFSIFFSSNHFLFASKSVGDFLDRIQNLWVNPELAVGLDGHLDLAGRVRCPLVRLVVFALEMSAIDFVRIFHDFCVFRTWNPFPEKPFLH